MSGSRPRTPWTSGLIAAATLAAAGLSITPATAISGPQAPDALSAAIAKLDIGERAAARPRSSPRSGC